ncbi:MAG TPA: glycosyl transferase family 1, partial [Ruegeria sp.]|nr:glycosyl transferase family 1 [Ruegeria sp.]
TLYQGPYEQFARQRAENLAQAQAMAKKQEARRAHLQSYVDRFRYKADKAKQAQSRLKALARMQPISSPQEAALRAFTFPKPEEMSPPIIHLEGGVTGYGQTEVLKRLNLRIDQDDRIALLGKNGQGKSTLSKLLSDRLPLMAGRMTRSPKLRIGYFAQHQVDELYVDETPLDHLRRLRPGETPAKWRARLAGFGLGAEQAET